MRCMLKDLKEGSIQLLGDRVDSKNIDARKKLLCLKRKTKT